VNEYRDEQVAAALEEFEAPDHAPDFFPRLEALLAEDEEARRLRRRLRLPLRGVRVPWVVRVAFAAAVAAALVLVFAVPRVGEPEEASAAEIKERVSAALAEASTMRGRLLYRAVDALSGRVATTRYSFATTARGDFRVTQRGGPSDVAYDATTSIERGVTTSESLGFGRFYYERRGVAPGPPDQGPSDWVLERQLGSTVRALLAANEPRVNEVVYRGRPAWRLVFSVRPNVIFADLDRLDVTVDQETAIPVRVLATLEGAFRSELRLDRLALDAKLAADTFTIDFPPGAEVARSRDGFRRLALDEVPAAVGYQPLVPAQVPAGFQLAEVAVARATAPTASGLNPRSRMVVSLAYRRGLDQLIVTTRVRDTGRRWRDPFAVPGVPVRSTRVTFASGALAGSSVRLAVDPRTIPHIWALTDELVVTVAGDLTRSELLGVAGSLESGP
jgi:hypothetical protein